MSANKLIGDSLDRLAAGAATAGRMLGEMWDEILDVLAEMVHRKFLSEIAGKQFHDRRAEVATHPTGKTRWVKKRQADREPLDAIVLHSKGISSPVAARSAPAHIFGTTSAAGPCDTSA